MVRPSYSGCPFGCPALSLIFSSLRKSKHFSDSRLVSSASIRFRSEAVRRKLAEAADLLDEAPAFGMRLGLVGLADDADLLLAFGATNGFADDLVAFFLGIGTGDSEIDRMDGEDAMEASYSSAAATASSVKLDVIRQG